MKSLKTIMVRSAILAGALALSAPAFAHGHGHGHAMQMHGQLMMQPGNLSHPEARALWLMHFANQAETETAQLAATNSQNDQVKDYAKMLLDDHTALDGKVLSFAREHNMSFPEMKQGTGGAGLQGEETGAEMKDKDEGEQGEQTGSEMKDKDDVGTGGAGMAGQSDTATGQEDQAAQADQAGQAAPKDQGDQANMQKNAQPPAAAGAGQQAAMMPLSHEEMNLLSHAKSEAKKLQNLKGRSFDRQFLSDNVKDHQQVIMKLNHMLAQVQNADLKNMIKDTLPKLQDHQKKAQELLRSMGGQARTPPPSR